MAKVKRNYWLKLPKDFFQSKEMKKLQKRAGGDTFVKIYLKLLLLSLTTEGQIFFEKTEDSLAEQLSIEIDEDINDIEALLLYLEHNKLLKQQNNGIYMEQIDEMLGSETVDAERKRRERNALSNGQCPNMSKKVPNIEIEIDKDIDKEIDRVLDKPKTYPSVALPFLENNTTGESLEIKKPTNKNNKTRAGACEGEKKKSHYESLCGKTREIIEDDEIALALDKYLEVRITKGMKVPQWEAIVESILGLSKKEAIFKIKGATQGGYMKIIYDDSKTGRTRDGIKQKNYNVKEEDEEFTGEKV